jgi:hypothetical protein
MTPKEQLNALAAPFEPAALEKNKDGFTYIKFPYVIERLNNVFGHLWSIDYAPFQSRNENEYSLEVIVTVQFSDGSIRTCKAVGSNRNFKSGTEDVHKACVSSGLKKAVMQIGVGNYIAMSDKDISIPESFVTEYHQQNQPVSDVPKISAPYSNNTDICGFGKHKGKPWVNVPIDYLKWLAVQPATNAKIKTLVTNIIESNITQTQSIDDVLESDDIPWLK